MRLHLHLLALAILVPAAALAQDENARSESKNDPPTLAGAEVEVYKTVGDVKLNMNIFTPPDHKPGECRAAIVFFFGGGWKSGNPKQFEQHCKYLASRGIVAISADYRVSSRHGVKAVDCVRDAKSAVRWIRANSRRLGIDPNRIVAAGGSAGGHIAACTGTIDGFDEEGEDASISSRPNAMILFNPALVLAPVNGELPLKTADTIPERTGVDPKEISPYHHVRYGVPPTLIFHGDADEAVGFETARWFHGAMYCAGNCSTLVRYPGQPHGFFNFGRQPNHEMFIDTLKRADCFLVGLGYLQGQPNVTAFVESTTKTALRSSSPYDEG